MHESNPDAGRPLGERTLTDPWLPLRIPLDGKLERSGFPPWLTAGMTLFGALILFQVVIAPIATIGLLILDGVPLNDLVGTLGSLVTEKTRLLLVANTVGQVFALAIPTLLVARLHSRRPADFLRISGADWRLMVLSIIGLAGLFPLVQWLGELNAEIPVPDVIRELERMMIEPIERMLKEPGALGFNIAMIAITPAICEEILFRGYVQRQVERSAGFLTGIVLTGFIFGAYHLQITKIIPLTVLGIYLGFITWRSGSILPAVVVHFANNAIAVVIGTYAARSPDMTLEDLDSVHIPWYFLVAGLGFLVLAVYAMNLVAADRLRVSSSMEDYAVENEVDEHDEEGS